MCDQPLPGCSSRAWIDQVKIEGFDESPHESQLTLIHRKEYVMTSDRAILITGVTGNQGGAVAQALQGTGFYLRGLTRMPDGERAAALARHGVDGVKHFVYTSVGSAHKR